MDLYDLHTHTTCSDGAVCPERLAALAEEQKLAGFAVTDHDTMRGAKAAEAAGRALGLRVLPGAELSAFDPETGRKVHLLVYLPHCCEALEPVFRRVSESREEACLRSLALLKKRFPIREEDARFFANGGTLFRTHLMRALMERGYADRVFGPFYHELFGQGGFAYAPVEYLPAEKAAAAIRESGGIAVLAHPGVYDSFETGRFLAKKGLLDGIEAFYPRRKAEDEKKIELLAEEFSLFKTGGTDFHGFYSSPAHPLGACRTTEETVLKICELSEKRKSYAI